MNTVCPGFVPHHVRANRCRRCFKDLQDHNQKNEVTTSFTLSLPRRRRESVAAAESPSDQKSVTTDPSDQSASFTITETTTLGRRTRQRSSSTSSWFQEKKVNEEQKEKIDALFRNADDSKADYGASESADTVAVIRLPDSKRSRAQYASTSDISDRTESKRTKSPDPGDRSTARKVAHEVEKVSEIKSRPSRPTSRNEDLKPPELPPKTLDKKLEVKKPEATQRDGSPKNPTSNPSANLSSKDSKPGVSKAITSESVRGTNSLKLEPNKSPEPSKFNERKPPETKFGEVRLRDSKLSEIRARASKFESSAPDLKRRDSAPKISEKLLERRESFTKSTSADKTKQVIDVKKQPPEPSNVSNDRQKESKPVLARFTNLRNPEAVSTPKTPAKKTASSSSEEEDSETDESHEAPKPAPKEPDKAKAVPNKLDITKPKSEPVKKEEKPQAQVLSKYQKEQENRSSQDTLEHLKTQLRGKEDSIAQLEREKADLQKKQQALLDKDKEALEKTALELSKMRTKISEMQSNQDEVKGENRKLKQELNKSKGDVSQKDKDIQELRRLRQDLKTAQQELSKTKLDLSKRIEEETSKSSKKSEDQEVERLRQDLKSAQQELKEKGTELIRVRSDLDKKNTGLEKESPEVSKLRQDLKDTKLELSRVRVEMSKKHESAQNKESAELSKLRQELKDKNLELSRVKLESSKKADDKDREELTKLRTKVTAMDELQKEVKSLKQELKTSQQELKESQKKQTSVSGTKTPNDHGADVVKIKLSQSEALCEELMEENEEIKKEVRELEQELEELHDNFREDQASEFRGLKKELEGAHKSCRVLQFKLRKAERRAELLELDRHALDDKVREFAAGARGDAAGDRGRVRELEKELGVARQLSAQLGRELREARDGQLRAETEAEALRSCAQQQPGSRSVTPTPQSRGSGKDLSDALEREQDLREQLRFAEQESRQLRRKATSLEQENETLMLQMRKLSTVVRERSGASEEEEELSAENLRLQLDLQEQELSVVRRKLEDTERENETLTSEVKGLQEKIIDLPLAQLGDPPKDSAGSGQYWEQKARLQELESRETRRKLLERDREVERLQNEVEIYRRKASKMMVRSRSLDSDQQVDLKRQLQLVEQEAGMLRQKVSSLEGENEKLSGENRRLSVRVAKKPPLSPAEVMQEENLHLKAQLEDLQEKLLKAEGNSLTDQLSKPRPHSVSESEGDLIAGLKRRLAARDEDAQQLQAKLAASELQTSRLTREHRRLKETLGNKKRPMKAFRDEATRVELRELVSELQDEICELQVTVRGREVLQESAEEEAERLRKELQESEKQLRQRQDVEQLQVDKGTAERDALRKELEALKSRASAAESQLSQLTKGGVPSAVDHAHRLQELTNEKAEAERRAKGAEEALEKKTQRLRDTQEKLNATAALKEDMARANRLLESQKKDVEKEVEEQRGLLVKAEAKAAELRSQVDRTDRDLTSLRKEANQLRNELEDEKGRVKRSSDQRASDGGSWSREREDLRRTVNDLTNRVEQLQQQLTDNEKEFIEKESKLREELKRKRETAVREAREKGEAALELQRDEERILRHKLQEQQEKLEKAESCVREWSEKCRKQQGELRKDREEWAQQRDQLEAEVQLEVKRREREAREADNQLRCKEEEVLRAKEAVVAGEREARRVQAQLEEADQLRIKTQLLEQEADRARDSYHHLTTKYEQLEEELVRTKARQVQEKEQSQEQLAEVRKELNQLTFERTTLKDSFSAKHEQWIKEKIDLQERAKELVRRLERMKSAEQERRRLQELLEEKETLVESYRKEERHVKDERDRLRKRLEDLSKTDAKATWSAAGKTTGNNGDQWAACRELESKMAVMADEMSAMQAQIAGLADERDELRAKLGVAERSAEEARTGSLKRERARHRDEADSARRKVQELRYQLEDIREQMDDAQLENKNLKLQVETDKNTFEIQAAELKSKINQLEEQKLLESTRGATRNIAKTRLELAWEKERSELQTLLEGAQRLSGDLRSRLEAAELQAEKERQASRRSLLDARVHTEREHADSRRKMGELHSSLLEIRESHAKVRGLYERARREREALLRERQQAPRHAARLQAAVAQLKQHVEKVSVEVTASADKKSLAMTEAFKEAIKKVKENFEELQNTTEAMKEEEQLKRNSSFRRAVSAQDMSGGPPSLPQDSWNNPQRVTNYPVAPPSMLLRPPPRRKPSLQRKSLSLDHTLVGGASHGTRLKIWESEGESGASTPAGSVLSLGGYGYETDSSLPDSEYRYGGVTLDRRRYRTGTDSEAAYSSREGSLDPAGSSESVPTATHKKTFKDRLRMLRRVKSVDIAPADPSSRSASEFSEAPSRSEKREREESLRSKISRVLRKPLGGGGKPAPGPALPPKGTGSSAPERPRAEKPLSASRGELSSRKSSSHPDRSPGKKSGVETPV